MIRFVHTIAIGNYDFSTSRDEFARLLCSYSSQLQRADIDILMESPELCTEAVEHCPNFVVSNTVRMSRFLESFSILASLVESLYNIDLYSVPLAVAFDFLVSCSSSPINYLGLVIKNYSEEPDTSTLNSFIKLCFELPLKHFEVFTSSIDSFSIDPGTLEKISRSIRKLRVLKLDAQGVRKEHNLCELFRNVEELVDFRFSHRCVTLNLIMRKILRRKSSATLVYANPFEN